MTATTLLALALLGSGQEPPSHCRAGERVVFSCTMASGKVASLCRPRHDAKTLQYRFGHPGEVPELLFPTSPAAAEDHFRSGTLLYSGGGGAWLAFDNDGYSYFVYTAIGKGWQKEGVSVRRGDDAVANLRCRGPVSSELGPALFDELNVPAAADEFEVP
jgi:hypothetical protein